MKLKLTEKRQEVEGVWTFLFMPEEPVSWKAGQYFRYHIDQEQTDDRGSNRFFTIASAPSEGRIQITTRFVPENGSAFKRDLLNLDPGDEITATGPNGSFVIDDPEQKYVFIAGGIGITPFRSIITELSHQNLPVNATLLYANRNEDVVFREDLESIAAKNPGLKIHYFIGENQITEQSVRDLVPDLSGSMYYISGPEPMVQSMEKLLSEMGIPENQIKRDYFPGYSQV